MAVVVILFVLLFPGWQPMGHAADLPGSKSAPAVSETVRLTSLANQLLWVGRFVDARLVYQQVLALDSQSVPARLGLGRIAALLSQANQARAEYSRAFQIDPLHPDAVLAFASVVTGPTKETLLGNFLTLSRLPLQGASIQGGSRQTEERISDAVARLAVERKLAGRTLESVVNPHQSYRLQLSELRTNGLPSGIILRARINGKAPLRLQLDSGAKGLILNPAAGRAAGLEILAGSVMVGFGSEQPTFGHVALAASLEVDTLKITNVLAQVSDTDLVPRADGLIGLELFRDFLIRLSPSSRRLDLEPLEFSQVCVDCNQAYRLDNLLLLHATINGEAEGNFILDTGSAISLISNRMVAGGGHPTRLNGAQGQQDVALRSTPASFRIGLQRFLTFEYATLDTGQISERYGTSIAGAIGYSLLRDLNVMVDFRRGLVKLSRR